MEVLTYKAASPLGLEAKIFSSFSDITPHNVENVFVPDSQSILEPEYVSGFVAADGTRKLKGDPVSTNKVSGPPLYLPNNVSALVPLKFASH